MPAYDVKLSRMVVRMTACVDHVSRTLKKVERGVVKCAVSFICYFIYLYIHTYNRLCNEITTYNEAITFYVKYHVVLLCVV